MTKDRAAVVTISVKLKGIQCCCKLLLQLRFSAAWIIACSHSGGLGRSHKFVLPQSHITRVWSNFTGGTVYNKYFIYRVESGQLDLPGFTPENAKRISNYTFRLPNDTFAFLYLPLSIIKTPSRHCTRTRRLPQSRFDAFQLFRKPERVDRSLRVSFD